MEDEDKWFIQEIVTYNPASHYIKTEYILRHILEPFKDRDSIYATIINKEPLPKAEAQALCKLLHNSKPLQADAWRRYKELEWQETKLKIQTNIDKLLTTVNQLKECNHDSE
jgi:hypothetical protein